MKLISFVVPCYNSQAYMERCVDSLLIGGEEVEIILIDDGSADATGEIADRYLALYPKIVRVVHQANGGHGSGVNKGLELAEGMYFKVVDSDDWLDGKSYEKLLAGIRRWGSDAENLGPEDFLPDLIICNYLYDHLEEGVCKAMRYRNVFPGASENRFFTWNEIGTFRPSQYLIMHSQVFRTEVLRRGRVRLPEHTFYVDNLFACQPLPLVKRICYLDLDLYHYYIGREDQSVNEKVMIRRIDQLILVTRLVTESVDLEEVGKQYPRLAGYLLRNISIMMAMTSIHLLLMQSGEGDVKLKKLWKDLRKSNPKLYGKLRFTTLSGLTYLPGRIGHGLTLSCFRIARRCYHFQ